MSEATPLGDRRAQLVSLSGLLIQLTLFGVALGVSWWDETRSDALVAMWRHLLGGVLIWVVLLLVFTQRRRSRLEDLETQQLKRAEAAGVTTNIFDVGDESLLLERRRLAWTYKFVLPAFMVLLILYHLGSAGVWFNWVAGFSLGDAEWHRAGRPLVAMVFLAGMAFVSFVFARFAVGMSRAPHCRLLRAGGSYLVGNALTATLLVVTMALAGGEAARVWAEPIAAYVVNAVVLLLGVEFCVNFILEFYRPRRGDDELRPAFDSRLLALFSEPGGIVRSIADTINYQFGFEVSGTWFYKLMQRSVFPLAVLTVAVLILLSSVVIIDVDEQAYIERFGSIHQARDEPLGPGIHLKAPWPIDRVVRARVRRVNDMTVGTKDEESWKKREHVEDADDHQSAEHELAHAVLWTEEHTDVVSGMLVLVANAEVAEPAFGGERQASGDEEGSERSRIGRGEGVSLLMISAVVEYRIKDLHDYLYRYQEPERVLESVAQQALSGYAAGHDAAFLMGRGRGAFGLAMKERVQKRCDEMGIGLAITMVGIHAHPPSKDNVADRYQNVIAAEIRKSATVEHAHGLHARVLTLATGDMRRAVELDAAIQEMNRLTGEADRRGTPELQRAAREATERVDDLLLGNKAKGIAPSSGAVAATIAQARADRAAAVSAAESKLRSYESDLIAYQAAPELFKMRRYLDMLQATLPDLRKYVYTGDPENLIVEYETKQGGFLDLSTEEEPSLSTVHTPH